MTLCTPRTFAACAMRSATAACCAALIGEPSSVLNTIVPVPPAASGKAACSRSVTCAVGVPGIEISPLGVLPAKTNAPAAAARIASHTRTTSPRRRVANRPIR